MNYKFKKFKKIRLISNKQVTQPELIEIKITENGYLEENKESNAYFFASNDLETIFKITAFVNFFMESKQE